VKYELLSASRTKQGIDMFFMQVPNIFERYLMGRKMDKHHIHINMTIKMAMCSTFLTIPSEVKKIVNQAIKDFNEEVEI